MSQIQQNQLSNNQNQQQAQNGNLVRQKNEENWKNKIKSKKDFYNFFEVIGNFYLPHERYVNAKTIEKVLSGKIKVYENKEIIQCKVIKTEEFSLQKQFDNIMQNQEMKLRIPDHWTARHCDAVYFWNVYNTITNGFVKESVKKVIIRQQKVSDDKQKENSLQICQKFEKILDSIEYQGSARGKIGGFIKFGSKKERKEKEKKIVPLVINWK